MNQIAIVNWHSLVVRDVSHIPRLLLFQKPKNNTKNFEFLFYIFVCWVLCVGRGWLGGRWSQMRGKIIFYLLRKNEFCEWMRNKILSVIVINSSLFPLSYQPFQVNETKFDIVSLMNWLSSRPRQATNEHHKEWRQIITWSPAHHNTQQRWESVESRAIGQTKTIWEKKSLIELIN